MHELSRDVRITGNRSTATNATGRLNGDIVDMDGFEGVLFIADYAATNAGADSYLAVQTGTATDAMSDTTGEQRLAVNTVFVDHIRAGKRFARGVLISTASGETKALLTIQYGARALPTTNPAGTTGIRVYSPGSGTATG